MSCYISFLSENFSLYNLELVVFTFSAKFGVTSVKSNGLVKMKCVIPGVNIKGTMKVFG
jgi:sporulation-control protein spo0M